MTTPPKKADEDGHFLLTRHTIVEAYEDSAEVVNLDSDGIEIRQGTNVVTLGRAGSIILRDLLLSILAERAA